MLLYLSKKSNPDCLSKMQQNHRDFSFEANLIVSDFFNNNQKVKSIFRYSGEVLFHANRKFNGGPVVILVSGTKLKTNQFFDYFRLLLEKYYLTESLMDYEIPSRNSPSRLELETIIFEHLRTHKEKILLLRGVDNLDGTAPLVLHSLTDPESSPFKASFVVASVNPKETSLNGGYNNCEEEVLK